ncbi:hypothetical protein GALL_480350 [mine drainage metagenome]|uniref:Uncharacterized protein n=1 Tax=mine drainage metagenome TaxID=410659 RepID=A0A1J5PYK7_9ZZZZ
MGPEPLFRPSRITPLVISSTITDPISALTTDPRPPPRLLPPSTAAVSAAISSPMPVSVPAPPRRAAYSSPDSPHSMPEMV